MADPDLPTMIKTAVQSGAKLALDYDTIVKSAPSIDQAVVPVEIDVNLSLDTLYQTAGVLGGQSLLSLVPAGILPGGTIVLQSVVFTLFTTPKQVGGVSCVIAFAPDDTPPGLPWTVATVNGVPLTFRLETIAIDWVEPLQDSQSISADVIGAFDIGTAPNQLTLDVEVTFPDATVTVREGQEIVNLGGFFAQFKLPKVGFLDQLYLAGFTLSAQPGNRAFQIAATIETLSNDPSKPPPPLTLIPGGSGGNALLGLDSMYFSFSYAPGAIQATIGGLLVFEGKIALTAAAAYDSAAGTWTFSGAIDVPTTRWYIDGTPPTSSHPIVTVKDFANVLFPNANVPAGLDTLGVAVLSVDYTYATGGGNSSYTFNGVFDGQWTLGSADVAAQLGILISSQAGQSTKQLSADFSLDGFAFTLTYTFGTASDISVDITSLGIEGDYNLATHIATVTFAQDFPLGHLLAWFVGSVTGNRFFALPKPWDSIADALKIPKGTTITLDTSSLAVTCTYPVSPPSLFGISITGVTLGYDRQKATGGNSGLTIKLDGTFPPGMVTSWDPGTEQPPAVPGQGSSLIDLKLAAAGQHIGFATAPETVSEAISELQTALSPANWSGDLYPKNMTFGSDIGWLFGADLLLLGQAEVKLIFNDPSIYGLKLHVNPSGKKPPTALDAVANLDAEILYRKVSDTVGEYSGTLILPDQVRQFNFGAVQITLPKISLSIYTNGDFKIDVGFPYNRDFSQSFAVDTVEYSGAGGFYFAKLDGLDPAELPQVNPSVGVFNPVNEIGVGFEIGVRKGFSSGPLSASISIMIQALFQGTFAKFTLYSNGDHDEYYDIQATLAIVGQVSGEIDFVIISASVQITIYVEIDLDMIAHRQALVTVSAGVSASVTVRINLGLFSIHIHCSFSTTITEHVAFGQNTAALWDQTRLMAMTHHALAAPAPVSAGWQPVQDSTPLTVYFLPQLTAGNAYPMPDSRLHWFYVGQLGLNNPGASPNPVDPTESYADFIRGVLRWTLNAIDNAPNQPPVPAATVDRKTLTRKAIAAFQDALGDPTQQAGIEPAVADIQALFKNAFQTNVKKPVAGTGGATLGVGFFPLLPGITVSLQAGQNTRVLKETAPIDPAALVAAKSAGPADALPARSMLHAPRNPTLTAGANPPTFNETLLRDYVLLAMRAGLQKMLEIGGVFAGDNDPQPIGTILAALDNKTLDGISGMTSRFMLHGTRRAPQGAQPDQTEPLYALTGQQDELTSADLAAPSLSLSLMLDGATGNDWGVTFDGGVSTLTLSSTDATPAVFAPSQIPQKPVFDTTGIVATTPPLFSTQPEPFYLKTAIDIANVPNATLWQLPPAFLALLGKNGAPYAFTLRAAATAATGNQPGQPVPTADYGWKLAVDVTVRRIAMPGSGKSGGGYLGNTYEISTVDQAGLLRLEQLIGDIDPTSGDGPVSGVSLAYQTAGSGGAQQLTLAAFDFVNAFIVQSNFSTETRPPSTFTLLAVAAPGTSPADNASLIYKVWTAGITNSGGYYLFYSDAATGAGLPDSLFNSGDNATITVIVAIDPAKLPGGVPPFPPYVTSIQATGYPAGGTGVALYVAADPLTTTVAVLPPGQVGIQVSRPQPTPPSMPTTAADYGNTLDQLYNLITMQIATIGGTAPTLKGLPASIGPTDDTSTTWVYNQVFPLYDPASSGPTPGGSGPSDAGNPYRFIGETVVFDLVWTDLYGNQLDPVSPVPTPVLKYYDPLTSLARLPYLTLGYGFAAGPPPQLMITIACNMPTYGSGDGDRQQRDLAAYALACYQLTTTPSGYGVTASLATSLLPATQTSGGGAALPVPAILGYLRTVYDALRKLPLGGTPVAPPAPLSIGVDIDRSKVATALYFPLTVSLTLQRNGPIADGFAADGPVQSSTIPLALQLNGTGTAKQTLRDVAQAFEQIFAALDLKMAVGSAWRSGDTAQSDQVWIVRYGASGISPAFDVTAATSYAPRPLSNALLSRPAVSVRTLVNGVLSQTGSDVAVTGIDLDAEMRRFLAAFDEMFSPQNLVPAALVNGDAVTSLSDSKKAIVEQFLPFVTDLATGQNYDPATDYDPNTRTPITPIGYAADGYRQECLMRLAAFYDMSSVLVVPLTARLGQPLPGAINLFGMPAIPAATPGTPLPDGPEFTLTSGKAALSTTAVPMAIGLYPKNPSHYADFTAPLEFPVGALEHDISAVMVDNTLYRVGSWLKLVNPPTLQIGQITIPIPARAFPDMPQLLSQFADDIAWEQGASTDDQNALLRAAKSWSLNGSYVLPFVAQDTVTVDVLINEGLGTTFTLNMAAPSKDLLDTLIEFNALYPQLKQIFVDQKLASIRTPQDPSKVTLLHDALASFSTLVGDVATCSWALAQRLTGGRPMMQLAGGGLAKRETRYTIDQTSARAATDPWTCIIRKTEDVQGPVGILPQLRIPGCKTVLGPAQTDPNAIAYRFINEQTGQPLTAGEAWPIADRTISVEPIDPAATPLNVLDRQSGLLSMMISRNATLPEQFRYKTPWVAYKQILYPTLDPTSVTIEMAGVGTANGKPVTRSLADHLTHFFDQLLAGSGTKDQVQGSFQAEISFESPATQDAALQALQFTLPITLRLPTTVTYGASGGGTVPAYVTAIADRVRNWLETTGITPTKRPDIWPASKIVFAVTLYSSISTTGDPILQLRNVDLSCRYVSLP